MLKTEIEALVKKYRIIDMGDGNLKIFGNPAQNDLAELKAGKAEILAYFAEEKAEREAKAKATITFVITGWESHTVSVDTRIDIDEQLRQIADYYRNDTSYERVKSDYNDRLAEIARAEAKKAAATAKDEAVFARARETGEKQVLREYMDECDGTACECSYDAVTIYAMPDGSTTEKRNHTF